MTSKFFGRFTLVRPTHLPHDDAEAPDVGGRGELPERDGLWGRPPHGDLAASGGVGAVHVALQDLAAQPEVGDLAHQLRVDQNVPGGGDEWKIRSMVQTYIDTIYII